METLLKITTIPIEYELKIHRARLEYSSSKSELIANRIKGGLTIKKIARSNYNWIRTMHVIQSALLLWKAFARPLPRASPQPWSYCYICKGRCHVVRPKDYKSPGSDIQPACVAAYGRIRITFSSHYRP